MIGLFRHGRLRLGLYWLWLRYAYPFHWAHKPLCERFQSDVLRVGKLYLCRSCTLAYLGLACGALLSVRLWQPLTQFGAALFLTLATVTISLSFPTWYRRWPRPLRDLLRFAMGVTIALCGYLLLSGQMLVGLLGALALTTFWKAYMALRRPRRLNACAGCPELHDGVICTGFAMQAERVRCYEIAATERIVASGFLPPA